MARPVPLPVSAPATEQTWFCHQGLGTEVVLAVASCWPHCTRSKGWDAVPWK